MNLSDRSRYPLSARDEQFRRAVADSQAGYFLIDRDGKFVWVNGAWLRMHGFSDASSVIGRHFSLTQVGDDLADANEVVKRVLSGQSVAASHFTRRMADGRVGHHTFAANPVVQDGVVLGLEGFLIDKTAFEELEELHSLLFDQMLDGFSVLEPALDDQGLAVDFRLVEVNPALTRLVGLPADRIAGRMAKEIFPWFDRELVEAGAAVLRTGEPASLQASLPRPERFIEIQLFRVSGGRLAMMLHDTTKRQQAEATLRENDKLLRDTQEIAGLGSYVLNIPADRWTSSEVLDRIFGIDANFQRSVDGWLGLVHPDFVEVARAHFLNHVLAHKGRFDLEYPVVRPSDGRVVWVHGQGEVQFGPGGEPLQMIGTIQDISERKQNEWDQEQAVAFLRLLNTATDLDELLRSVTDHLCSITGVQSAAIRLGDEDLFPYRYALGLPELWMCPRDGMNREPAEVHQSCLCGMVLAGRSSDNVLPCVRRNFSADGAFWSNHSAAVLLQQDGVARSAVLRPDCPLQAFQSTALIPLRFGGRTLGLIQLGDTRPDRIAERMIPFLERMAASLAIAIEQRTVQAALRDNEERYRMISENTGDIIWLYDLKAQRFTYVSPSGLRYGGTTIEELLSRPVRKVLSPRSYEVAARNVKARIAAVEAGDLTAVHASDELELVRPDGEVVDTEVVTTLLMNTQGQVCRVLGVSRDITERKQAEARLMQAQKMESVGRLAGGVAHDFNNQLTVINGYSQLMLATIPSDSSLRKHVEQIYAAGERAASLTRQLLAFSRKQMMHLQALNLNRVVLTLHPMLTRLVGEDVEVRVTPFAGAAVVRADLHQIEQVVMNLAVNARDAMPAGGVLSIEISVVDCHEPPSAERLDARAGRFVRMAVSDTGHGMDEATRMRIFEPFFTTKEVGKGTGLGLSTVQGVVSQSDGFIEVTSEPGTGTTFEIFLPALASPSPGALPAAQGLAPTGYERVLVVEDQPAVRDFAVQVLSSYGYQVIGASSAKEAMEIARNCPDQIDLLLTDVVMPEMGGVELAKCLQALYPRMQRLYMSGYSGAAISEHRQLGSLEDFIQKPFSPEQLAVKVRAVLGEMG
ncbi:PAS domain S-box protein [uncultured Paludibaculum sp.]|uniref:PAS domain S-box protein n=1 Tax=uncultured Paludibaculum sp. TaxID=1765020 RepID=UPI002AAB810B|nr:PAS domain S-box protein [uncultured Paludibaculum sp.]